MARPVSLRADARPASSALLDHAIGLIAGRMARPAGRNNSWGLGPLVILTSGDTTAGTTVAAALGGQAVAGVTFHDGGTFDREIAAAIEGDRLDRLAVELAASRLVVVDRIERIRREERQHALIHLFDVSSCAGTMWVVSLPPDPGKTLVPQLASRLSGGLVVQAPEPASAPTMRATPTLGRIVRAAARHHDVTPEAVVGPSRARTVAAARSLAMYLARQLTGRSLQSIGAACGGRDHTTVLHAVRTCGTRLAHDPALAADVQRITMSLCGGTRTAETCRGSVDSPVAHGRQTIRRRGRRRLA